MESEFQIKIYYTTGDSFHTEETEGVIEHSWKNLEQAQESMRRIKNHNEYYTDHSNIWSKPKKELPDGIEWDKEYRILQLMLMGDDGKPFAYSPFWTGYFETLHYAEIIMKESSLGSYRP